MSQFSKNKHWVVIDMVRRQPQPDGEPFPMARLRDWPEALPPLAR
jgi:hypothetical protein